MEEARLRKEDDRDLSSESDQSFRLKSKLKKLKRKAPEMNSAKVRRGGPPRVAINKSQTSVVQKPKPAKQLHKSAQFDSDTDKKKKKSDTALTIKFDHKKDRNRRHRPFMADKLEENTLTLRDLKRKQLQDEMRH